MIQEALKYLVELGARAPHRETIGGIEYSDKTLQVIKPPRAGSLDFRRLQGFADFVSAAREFVDREQALIHVVSPWDVRYFSTLDETHRDRETYGRASMASEKGFPFGKFMAPEEFVIAAMTLIADYKETDRARLLELVGNVSAENVTTSADDGISQTVGVKAGITLVKKKEIENPFQLAPHRTFPEVKQPVSPFILRARQSGENSMPMLALFEADNGAWELSAIANIAEWLKEEVGALNIPILA
jgi:hypothetical protein